MKKIVIESLDSLSCHPWQRAHFLGKVNEDEFEGNPPGTLICTGLSWTNLKSLYLMTFEFTFKESGWLLNNGIIDMGYLELCMRENPLFTLTESFPFKGKKDKK